jgi:uncharacterized protein (TIGR02246 family)
MDSQTTELATTPKETIELFAARLSQGDVAGLIELYDEDASFAPQPDTEVTGEAAIRKALEGFAALTPTLTCNVTWVQEVGDLALVLNDWTMEGRQPDGEAVQMGGRAADVVRRGADGGWRFRIDCPWGLSG